MDNRKINSIGHELLVGTQVAVVAAILSLVWLKPEDAPAPNQECEQDNIYLLNPIHEPHPFHGLKHEYYLGMELDKGGMPIKKDDIPDDVEVIQVEEEGGAPEYYFRGLDWTPPVQRHSTGIIRANHPVYHHHQEPFWWLPGQAQRTALPGKDKPGGQCTYKVDAPSALWLCAGGLLAILVSKKGVA